ncbi:MAG: zinc-binding dehydrogenase [Pseudomonas sp.]|nr:zinc-binding dehydrogenase [Pseudomonas sp.]
MLHTDGKGVDVIVDIIAGDYVARNFKAAAMDGRIVQIGVVKGPATEIDLFPLLTKRLTHIGSTLRTRSADDKAAILEDLQAKAWPHVRGRRGQGRQAAGDQQGGQGEAVQGCGHGEALFRVAGQTAGVRADGRNERGDV